MLLSSKMDTIIEQILNILALEIYVHCLERITTKLKHIHIKYKPCESPARNVIHHSEHYLILNKNHDVLINSNEPGVKSLHYDLCQNYPNLVNPKLQHGFYFIHRLDYATSGAICLALHKKACSAASSAFQKRTTQKYYLALLRGHVSDEIIDISNPIGEDASEVNGSHRMCTADDALCLGPRTAHTRLLVLQRGLYDGYPATKVMLQPITGRRHQLRVHCSHIGHTIIGDFTYSRKKDVLPYRTFLHAYRLVLPNVVEPIDVTTPDPFTPDRLDLWTPVETLNPLDLQVFNKLNGNR